MTNPSPSSRKYASFDLEIALEVPLDSSDWSRYGLLGITCAAVGFEDEEPIVWKGVPRMTQAQCREMLAELIRLVEEGYTLLTWNGCKFDFKVLAEETGEALACARLAADHVDMMAMFTFRQGYYLSLQAALDGAGLQGKLKKVTLKNGTFLENMDGKMAPRLWAQGEYEAVLAYLREDVRQPIVLARTIEKAKAIRWTSKRGGRQQVAFDRLYTVRESFLFPQPDTSWMSNAPRRAEFIAWMPGGKLP